MQAPLAEQRALLEGIIAQSGDAIIVSEYAERRMAEGMPPKEAYSLAAKRMAGPVIAATRRHPSDRRSNCSLNKWANSKTPSSSAMAQPTMFRRRCAFCAANGKPMMRM